MKMEPNLTYDEIDDFFNPQSVALVGASADYRKLGNSILSNLLASEVEVYPVTRSREKVLGITAYPNLEEIPEDVDLVIIAVAAKYCPQLMHEVRAAGARNAVIISGGFSETGKRGAQLEQELQEAAREADVHFIGPNCVGVSNSRLFNGTFTMMPERGNIALISQSGALGGMLIYTTKAKRIGMSKFVSIGNATNIGFTDLLGYLAQDSQTKVITIYVEGVEEGRSFYEALRSASRRKPVVVLKGGMSDPGSRATLSHTGSLAGSPQVFEGMIRQSGCVTAPTFDSLFEIAKIFDYQPIPKNCNIGIISNTGGAAVLAADSAFRLGLNIPPLSTSTRKELSKLLSPMASVDNPVDVVASGGRREYKLATRLLLEDSAIDILLVICGVPTFAGMTQTEHAAGTLEGIRIANTDKPVVGVWLAGEIGKPGKDLLEMNRIPCYDDPNMAVLCCTKMSEYTRLLNR
ncbi:MAG: CoA-binding protein [Candidatus Thorarchaeota archaeon]|nr:CoA-binding protein [Candidatus Thorarchaeota archaeon]